MTLDDKTICFQVKLINTSLVKSSKSGVNCIFLTCLEKVLSKECTVQNFILIGRCLYLCHATHKLTSGAYQDEGRFHTSTNAFHTQVQPCIILVRQIETFFQ